MAEQYWKDIAYETMPGGMIKFLADDRIRVLECDPKFCKMTGLSQDELAENGLLHYCDSLDREFVHRSIRTRAKEKRTLQLEFRFKNQNGTLMWYQMTGSCVAVQGDFPAYICTLYDITESHVLQGRLRENLRALQSKQDEINELYHTVISGFAKIAADQWYTLLFANDRLFELVGYTRFQVKTLFNNEAGRLVHPRDLESFRTIIRSMNGKGRFSTKFRLLHRDGSFAWIRLDGSFINRFHDGVPVFYCFYTDIDEQKEQEAALQRQQYFTSLVTSSIAGGLTIFYDRFNWPIAYISQSLLDLLGYTEKEFQERTKGNLRNIVYPEDLCKVEKEFAMQLAEGTEYELEFRIKKKNDSIIWILEKGRKTRDEDNEVLFVSMYMDITERKIRTDDLVRQSTHDSLTKLYNRAYTRQSIEDYLSTHGDKHSSALLLLDLDNFKQVNDLYGHMEGDAVLIHIGKLLMDTFLSKDIIGRMGGDEFIVFLKEIHSESILKAKAQSLCDAICSMSPDKYKWLSASIGIIFVQDQIVTYEELVQAADLAMYQAKFNGKNNWYLRRDLANHNTMDISDYSYPLMSAPADAGLAVDLESNYGWIMSHAFNGVIALDLISGYYTAALFGNARSLNIPCGGNYAEIFPILVNRDILPADQHILWEMAELSRLQAAYDDGITKQSCQYRFILADGSCSWTGQDFYFSSMHDHPTVFICLHKILVEEKNVSGNQQLQDCYSTFWDAFPTKFQVNLTKQSYTLLHGDDSTFVSFPEEGSLQGFLSTLSGIIHPQNYSQFVRYFYPGKDQSLHHEDSCPIVENLMFREKDGTYRHMCCIIIPLHNKCGDQLLFISLADTEKGYGHLAAGSQATQNYQPLDSQQYHQALIQSGVIVFDWNKEENSLYYSSNLYHFLFLDSPEDLLRNNMRIGQGTHPEDWKVFEGFYKELTHTSHNSTEATMRLACKDGTYLWCRITASIMRDENNAPHRIVGTITNVNDAILSKQQLEYQGQHDPLTGLCNYAYYQEKVNHALKNLPDSKYCLSYCDIKNFKYINDIYGYETGDQLLQFMSNSLCQHTPTEAIVGRLSADRTSVLRKYTTKELVEESFEQFASSLLSYRDPITMQPIKIEIACGFYCIDSINDIAPFQDMINRASIAQKSAKEQSGSRYAFYSRDLRDRVIQEKEWELSLFQALENNEFIVFLQPQVSIQNDTQIMGAEALVRWQQTDGNLIPPADFIPLFEKTGGIVHLDNYVFQQVCQYLHQRISEGKPLYQISVNVSRITMMDPMFTEKYCKLKNEYDIPDNTLVLECTETTIMEDLAQFQVILKTLRNHGFLVAMDDFGTGYSSLNLLKNIDIDILKLDMGFFRGQEDPLKNDAIISGIFSIAKALKLHTLAEGIESMTLVDMLRQYGCDSIQGYVFSKPRPISEFDDIISEIIARTAKTPECTAETTEKKTAD